MKIVADDKIPFLKGVFEPYVDEVVYLPGGTIKKTDVSDADAIIVRTRTACNSGLLEGTKVKIVVTATIGTDHFDIPWLESAGIKWHNAPGCNSGSVRQYIGSILSLLIKEGIKPEETTLGVVGVGMVGSKVARLGRDLGFKVLLNDPPRERNEPGVDFVSLDRVLKESDIISFHTPLEMNGVDATYHMFNYGSLKKLKKGVVVINSSRGEVTSTNALLKGTDDGVISRIILDVWENEPDISLDLHNKVWIGTPHIAGYSADGKANGTSMSVQAISNFFALPLTNWQAEGVPMPETSFIKIDCNGLKPYQVAAMAILRTYNILEDDKRLRSNLTLFEKLRGEYPVRREFGSWKVELTGADTDTVKIIKDLGFNLL